MVFQPKKTRWLTRSFLTRPKVKPNCLHPCIVEAWRGASSTEETAGEVAQSGESQGESCREGAVKRKERCGKYEVRVFFTKKTYIYLYIYIYTHTYVQSTGRSWRCMPFAGIIFRYFFHRLVSNKVTNPSGLKGSHNTRAIGNIPGIRGSDSLLCWLVSRRYWLVAGYPFLMVFPLLAFCWWVYWCIVN